MSLRLKTELANFKAKGITPNDLTPDELEALVHAVDRVRNPFTEVNLDALGLPLYDHNGIRLWPLTIGACVWLEEFARKWWGDRPKAYFWAVVYCLMHGREPDAFAAMRVETEAFHRIKEDALKLAVCEVEITEAVDTALNFKRPPRKKTTPKDETGIDWASIIETLEGQSGIPAEKWIWQRSADYVVRAYHELSQFASRTGGQKATRMKDELDYALNQLAEVRSSILMRIEAERGKTA